MTARVHQTPVARPLVSAVKGAPATTGLLQRKCACGGSAGPTGECEECKRKRAAGLQTKLHVNESGDAFEREADQVADKVVRADNAPVLSSQQVSPFDATAVQRHCPAGPLGEQSGVVEPVLRSPGEQLDRKTRRFMESRFGHDFGDVRVHRDARAAQSARALNADAYTLGSHIAFAPGLFAPETASGQRLIAHELTHVLQQRGSSGEHLNVQRQQSSGSTLYSDPDTCESRVDITRDYNDFVRDVPGLIQQIPNATQEQKRGLTDMARYVFQPDGAANLTGYTILCCSRINTGLVMGRETAQAYIDPANSQLGMTHRVFEWMGEFRRNLDKEVLTRFLQIIAHEKRHLNLAGVFRVSQSALLPGRSDTAARNAEYRAEEILATAEELAVGRMALGPEFMAERDVQEKLFRSRNMIRNWVTETEFQRLRTLIIQQLRAKYGFQDGCDNALVVGVVRSMDRNEWFSCDYDTGGIHGPVPDGLNVCTDERHRFCRRPPGRASTAP